MTATQLKPTEKLADKSFVISRVYDATPQVLFDAWTQPAQMEKWWGPKGAGMVKAVKMELRVGGTYHYYMELPGGMKMWGKFVFREIKAPARLVYINSFSDEKGGITRHPMQAQWPLELLSVITFESQGQDKTKLTIEWTPMNASDVEVKIFDSMHDSMQNGWGGTLDQLGEFLSGKR